LKALARELILSGMGTIMRAGLATVYQVAFAAALLWPAQSPRARRRRARHFALKARENTKKNGALGISLLANASILVFLASAGAGRPTRQNKPAITATVDKEGFLLRTTPGPQPPSGGGGGGEAKLALASQAENLLVATAQENKTTPSALTTTAPSPLIMTPAPATISKAGIQEAIAKASSQGTGTGAGTGTGTGSGTGSGVGSGTGTGTGSGTGSGVGTGTGSGSAGGTKVSTVRSLAGWDLVVLVDQTSMVGDGGGYNKEMNMVSDLGNGGKFTSPTKINATLLPNILAQRNTLLEVASCYDDNMFPSETHRRNTTEMGSWVQTHADLGWGAFAILPKYTGRENTAVVFGSEFQWQAREVPKEERERVKEFLLSLRLPIFFISLGARPDAWHREIARRSGGGYLGYIGASTAKTLSHDLEKIWTPRIAQTGELIYERRNAPEVKSANLLPTELQDSTQEGLTAEESDRRAKNQ
jgi:hypothetical protein